MDEFGVLTERYGLKPQGKAAPMAGSKRPPTSTNSQIPSFGFPPASNPKSSSDSSWNTSSSGYKGQDFGDLEFLGGVSGGSNNFSRGSADQSVGSSFDYDSIFNSSAQSSSASNSDNDDIFGLKNSASTSNNDVFASFVSPPRPPRKSSPVDDLLGGYNQKDDDIFGGIGAKLKPPSRNSSVHGASNPAGFDDLIPGFGGSGPSNNGYSGQQQQSSTTTAFTNDPFEVFESTSKPVHTSSNLFSDPLEEFGQFQNSGGAKDDGDKVKNPTDSYIDELEEFAMGRSRKNIIDPPRASPSSAKQTVGRTETKFEFQKEKPSRHKEGTNSARESRRNSGDDIESIFSSGSRSASAPKSRSTSSMNKKEAPGMGRGTPSGIPSSMKKASSATNIVDDLSFMFGNASVFGEFKEVEGETEERRRARLGRQTRTQQRVAQAVAEMNERDFQTQQEQEERYRISQTLDIEIKRWAAGKEGNMRALLSSLQYVLWPECGWESVSLTDLITSTSVKKVYRKATLCVHPDKVQQKGASIEQKYTAEKVFDILKEAWKKFESEELR